MSKSTTQLQPRVLLPWYQDIDYPILAWMIIVHLLAIAALPFFSWQNLAVLLITHYVMTSWGIGIAYHRMLSHRALKMPKFWERIFATIGVLNLQGSPLRWIATHRVHHAFSDTDRDPHNSHRGFWFSHLGWMLRNKPAFNNEDEMRRFARDIAKDPYYKWLESFANQTLLQVIFGMILWATLGFGAMMWGIFLRIVIVYHCTWLINSATHQWGYQTYKDSNDSSRNNWWATLFTWGEGWHNNHHKFAHLANMGHRWWEIDFSMMVIRLLQWVGIAYDVNDEVPGKTTSEEPKINLEPRPLAVSSSRR
jgi:stearoyl-CoA desaturase (delta-9 desaturase)